MVDYGEALKDTIRRGQREQDMFNLQKYRYSRAFDTLPEHNTHVVAIVLFRFIDNDGMIIPRTSS